MEEQVQATQPIEEEKKASPTVPESQDTASILEHDVCSATSVTTAGCPLNKS